MSEERLKVLDMLRAGQINADEAEQLLANLGDEPLTEPRRSSGRHIAQRRQARHYL